jgi:hypothetical protein
MLACLRGPAPIQQRAEHGFAVHPRRVRVLGGPFGMLSARVLDGRRLVAKHLWGRTAFSTALVMAKNFARPRKLLTQLTIYTALLTQRCAPGFAQRIP